MKHSWFNHCLLAWLLLTVAGMLDARDLEVLVVSGSPPASGPGRPSQRWAEGTRTPCC
jgi:hypothetical protein